MNKKLLLAVLFLLLAVFSLSAKIGLSVKLGGAYDLMKGKTTTSGFEDSFFYLPVEYSGKGIGIDASLGFDFTKRLGIYADFTSVSAQEIRYKSDILGDLVVKKDVITFDGEPLKGAIVQLMAEVHARGGFLYNLTPDYDLDIRVGGGFSFGMIQAHFSYKIGDNTTIIERFKTYDFGVAGYVYAGYKFADGFSAGLTVQPDLYFYNIAVETVEAYEGGYQKQDTETVKGSGIGYSVSATVGLSYTF